MVDDMEAKAVDVIHLGDFRLPGIATQSIAEEVRCESEAGYRTSLINVSNSATRTQVDWQPYMRRVRDLPKVSLASNYSRIRAKLLVIHHPEVFLTCRERFPAVQADRVILVAQGLVEEGQDRVAWVSEAAYIKAQDLFGTVPLWAPATDTVRKYLESQSPQVKLLEFNWRNLVRLPKFVSQRRAPSPGELVIGRHLPDGEMRWPQSEAEIFKAYESNANVRVKILGGLASLRKTLGFLPKSWECKEFSAEKK